jgi:DNA-directed RNA polymerase specialized sigma24 family protein
MEGYTNEEIVGKFDCSLSTVERGLRLIRTIWKRKMDEPAGEGKGDKSN